MSSSSAETFPLLLKASLTIWNAWAFFQSTTPPKFDRQVEKKMKPPSGIVERVTMMFARWYFVLQWIYLAFTVVGAPMDFPGISAHTRPPLRLFFHVR
ncbi:hypothetical protein AX16_007029 [Volvariella volvacea WC 439]|nr:hypothetical protein AX16_007029 [Volvariella volvacea WC 439]